jgi:N-acetylglucosaminyldiphosphoundecaprenol N-acetyl-beta-D-mannosaminyltransferase
LRRHKILGVWIDDCDEESAAEVVGAFLREQPARPRHVCTVNPEFVMEARSNPTFKRVLRQADLCTPDGAGIILAGKLLRRPFKGRATGVGLVNRLGALSAREGYSLYLLGAAPGVAEKAAATLQARYPGARIAGTFAGSPGEDDWPGIRERLWATRPDALLVAYGAPKQELWIAAHRDELPDSVKVAMGVGGVFDYLSGKVRLAPAWVRRIGLEWLFRLAMQPWRWRRIARVMGFGLLVLFRISDFEFRIRRNKSQQSERKNSKSEIRNPK